MRDEDEMDARIEERERRMENFMQWCPKCGDRRLQVNGVWTCLVCNPKKVN